MGFYLYLFFYSVAIFGIFLIASLVIIRQKTEIYKNFAIFAFTLGLWLLLQFLSQLFYQQPDLALLLLRSAVLIAAYMGTYFLLFAASYTGYRIKTKLYAIPLFLLSVLGLTKWNITSADIVKDGIAIKEVGIVYAFLILYLAFLFVKGLYLLFKDTRKTKDQGHKSRNRILLFGFSQAIIINLVFGVSSSGSLWTQIFVPVTSLVMVVLVAYAIVRHKLFDIRLIVMRSLAYLFLVVILGALYSLLLLLVSRFVFSDSELTTTLEIIYALIAVLLGFTVHPLKRVLDKLTNRFFFKEIYDPQSLLDQLNQILVSTIDTEELLTRSAKVVQEALKATYLIFLLPSQEKGPRIIGKMHGGNSQPTAQSVEIIYEQMKASKEKAFFIDDLDAMNSDEKIYHYLHEINGSVIASLITHNQRVGFMLIGIKKNGGPYNNLDMRVIDIISGELAIAVQNALRFEEIRRFNITLQKRIEEATRELRRANSRLREIDKAKDEFISMASHQLRTPLTAVKGYLSMVLDGDAGPVKKNQKELVQRGFDGAQKMVYLIADMLNVSRLQTGKFVIENQPTKLADMVESEVNQLQEQAQSRGVELTYQKPEDFPTLSMDENKIRQVVMNFIDNAIYYTPRDGKIDVNLEATPETVTYTVTDTGVGVPRSVQHHLFSKFYRAENAKKLRPDGTGLGLYMAKKVVVAQGGAIIFKSTEGKGSTFGFSFPRKTAEAETSQ